MTYSLTLGSVGSCEVCLAVDDRVSGFVGWGWGWDVALAVLSPDLASYSDGDNSSEDAKSQSSSIDQSISAPKSESKSKSLFPVLYSAYKNILRNKIYYIDVLDCFLT